MPTPPAFHIMVKPRGSICNLDCQYCFYLKKEQLYPGGSFRMSPELLEDFTRQYIAAQRAPEVTFAWQGGEPTLMGLDFFRRAVELQARYARPGMHIQNAFQTNGTLLDDDWCQFFHENQFLIGLSIDGPQPLHDAYRRDKGGRSVFESVLRAARLMRHHAVEFNALTCVSAANAAHGAEVYRFLRDEVGVNFVQFIPIVERDTPSGYQEGSRVTARSVSGPQYGDFLIAVFDEWVRRDIGQVFVQIFDVALAAWLGQPPGLCVFEKTCGQALALEFNGDLYACDHYVEPRAYLGNIAARPLAELVALPQQIQFGQAKQERLPGYCRECEVSFICNGGCPKDRLLKTPQSEPGLSYLCAGYRAFFNYIDAPMKTMAAYLKTGRAPAEIMPLMAGQPGLHTATPGTPCPCGSGHPVEACHRAPGGYIPPGQSAPPPHRLPGGRRH